MTQNASLAFQRARTETKSWQTLQDTPGLHWLSSLHVSLPLCVFPLCSRLQPSPCPKHSPVSEPATPAQCLDP